MHFELHQEKDLEQLLDQSQQSPVAILKHSTQCSRSAAAYDEFQNFSEDNPEIQCATVLVIENRAISDELEDRLGIRHESPQAILISKGNPVWHANHFAVTAKALVEAVSKQSR